MTFWKVEARRLRAQRFFLAALNPHHEISREQGVEELKALGLIPENTPPTALAWFADRPRGKKALTKDPRAFRNVIGPMLAWIIDKAEDAARDEENERVETGVAVEPSAVTKVLALPELADAKRLLAAWRASPKLKTDTTAADAKSNQPLLRSNPTTTLLSPILFPTKDSFDELCEWIFGKKVTQSDSRKYETFYYCYRYFRRDDPNQKPEILKSHLRIFSDENNLQVYFENTVVTKRDTITASGVLTFIGHRFYFIGSAGASAGYTLAIFGDFIFDDWNSGLYLGDDNWPVCGRILLVPTKDKIPRDAGTKDAEELIEADFAVHRPDDQKKAEIRARVSALLQNKVVSDPTDVLAKSDYDDLRFSAALSTWAVPQRPLPP